MGGVRRGVAVAFPAVLVAGLVLWGAAAFACTNLATINLSSSYGHPGDRITIVGTSFPVPRAQGSTPTPVTIHWGAIDGPAIGTVVPDRTGLISLTFTVPEAAPGNVVIVGVQRRALVNPETPEAPPIGVVDEPGTPARATFRVLAPGEHAPVRVVGADFAAMSEPPGTTALFVLIMLLGTISLSLFAGGAIAFVHQVRLRRATPEPWRTWGYY
ncbi:MAG: hypothetical protein AB1673_13835 [Actinomycetota bacterium]|jgi:hypothetical protein